VFLWRDRGGSQGRPLGRRRAVIWAWVRQRCQAEGMRFAGLGARAACSASYGFGGNGGLGRHRIWTAAVKRPR